MKTRAFSLVEMLVVIAVIGIMAAIAVPQIGKITEKSKDAKDKRNAQSLSSMFSSATSAGYTFSEETAPAIVNKLIEGVTIKDSSSSFDEATFKVPGITGSAAEDGTEAKRTLKYLSYDPDTLSLEFNPAGNPATEN